MTQTSQPITQQYNKILDTISTQQLKINTKQLTQLITVPHIDRALGCLFGSFIGDSLGSYCEFQGPQAERKMDVAMGMPGGGPFFLRPGQITDDSEMALHMLSALLEYDPDLSLEQQYKYIQYCVAQQYIKWLGSDPFDIGLTCNKAIASLQQHISTSPITLPQYNLQMSLHRDKLNKSLQKIQKYNRQSLSNGVLMRCGPLTIFHSLVSRYRDRGNCRDNLRQLIYDQAKLTHCHAIALDSAVEWVEMLSDLINRSQNNTKQKQLEQLNCIFNNFLQKDNHVLQIKNDILHQIQQKQPINATQHIGYFKHAYHFAIYEMTAVQFMLDNLKNNRPHNPLLRERIDGEYFKNSLRFVIKQGGDTDTNACIVGGFLGAIVGFGGLPKEYLVKQLALEFDTSLDLRMGHARFYEPKRGFINSIRLIKKFIK